MHSNFEAAKPVFRKGSLVRYAHGADFDGSRLYKIVNSNRSCLFGVSYDISNGKTTLTGIKEGLLTKAHRV